MDFCGILLPGQLPDCFPPGCVRAFPVEEEAVVLLCDCDRVSDAGPYLPGPLRERFRRYRWERDRHRFAVRQVLLRCLLAQFPGVEKSDGVAVIPGPHGKPHLAGGSGPALHFSLSQGDAMAAVAISPHLVGIDLEVVKPGREWDAESLRVFSTREIEDLRQAPGGMDEELFLRYWTAKEAILKAHGSGLQTNPADLDLQVSPGAIRLRQVPPGFPGPDRWRVRHLSLQAGLVVALALCPGPGEPERAPVSSVT